MCPYELTQPSHGPMLGCPFYRINTWKVMYGLGSGKAKTRSVRFCLACP